MIICLSVGLETLERLEALVFLFSKLIYNCETQKPFGCTSATEKSVVLRIYLKLVSLTELYLQEELHQSLMLTVLPFLIARNWSFYWIHFCSLLTSKPPLSTFGGPYFFCKHPGQVFGLKIPKRPPNNLGGPVKAH